MRETVSGRGSGPCGAPVVSGTSFCIRHLCMRRTCTNAKAPGHDLCRKCKCEASACGRMRILDWDERDGHRGATFCEGHECEEAGCARKREGDGDGAYCLDHRRCAVPGCHRAVNAQPPWEGSKCMYCYEPVETRRENGTTPLGEWDHALQEALKRQERKDEETRRVRVLRELQEGLGEAEGARRPPRTRFAAPSYWQSAE
ncbi:uncharacterized protein J7T54_002258 [Emericellopsis cladophorae]|uniref:Uncharacterized protein n=1 Tax=Emericellopsis cladophorae TaxID=2686198 RepID=A0A9P9Y128_9HYPO|nr:uncharacterized protein J7T54_002258 [Emericellopsis cladophorae]KAI6781366.1 hypothetical protein J7T54_002258 [Emericellopsis cladophorae]